MTSLKNWYKGTVSLSLPRTPQLRRWLPEPVRGSQAWAFHQRILRFSWLSLS